jgi:predicted DCC family thiol-disulfide oxidoreductase YuxK
MEKIEKLDRLGLINRVPLSVAVKTRKPGMPAENRLSNEMHLITPEGKIYRGAEAVGVLATLFPQSRLLGEIILLPGVRAVARLVYRQVARHRMRLSRLLPLN